jgi:tetratricopeptide (TPR) repeat protein
MVCSVLIVCALVGADRVVAERSPAALADLSAYQAAKSQVGRDAEAHVRLALWCESRGMASERMKHLALAVLNDPSNALARGLLGMVAYQGKWGRPDEIGTLVENDPAYRDAIREYLERRSRTADKVEAQMKLALWCDQKGLKAQALTHYEQVTLLDPTRDTAWKHLGFKKQGNRWVKPEFAAAAKLDAELQKQANKHWKSILEKVRDDLRAKDSSRRVRAESELAEIADPRAVPMIWALFVSGSEGSQITAVKTMSQIDGPTASNALSTLAIFAPSADVRSRASASLAERDLRDILTQLISLIRKPFKYQVQPMTGPGSTGVLFIEGEKFNVRRIYRSMAVDAGWMPAGGRVPSAAANDLGMFAAPAPTPLALESQLNPSANSAGDPYDFLASQVRSSALSSGDIDNSLRQLQRVRQSNDMLQQSLAQDVRRINAINDQINLLNSRVLPIVENASRQRLGAEPDKWKSWWTDQLGYAFQASQPSIKPTLTEFVDTPSWSASLECFGAGTRVHAAGGPRTIESIQVGDRVLSQNTTTGVLSYQPVMAVHRTRSAATVRVAIDGDAIIATGIHRFWKPGKGWTMARELKRGDRLRMLGSVVEVRGVEIDKNQTVYNLEVAENGDFFVGDKGVLVHDSKFVKPVPGPFDLEPELAALSQSGRK